jgi:CelD/BcsL family acetyltransferase involved in cellulose biosynthesis
MNISVFHKFEEIKSIWINFQETAYCYGFQTYEWLSIWNETIGERFNFKLCLVKVDDIENNTLMILPLGIRKIGGIKILTWLGDNQTDYHAPLISSTISIDFFEKNINEIWQEIRRILPHYDVIHLEKQPEYIDSIRNPFALMNVKQLDFCAYSLLVEDSWEDYSNIRIKKKIKSDSRRQIKRLEEIGSIKYEIANDRESIKKITDVMIKHKIRKYSETGVSNMFSDSKYIEFYHKIAYLYANQGLIHVAALSIDNLIIAAHWGILHNKRFYYIMPTYAGGRWRKYSAGRLLLIYLLKWNIENGNRLIDFTIGDEPYKKDWCNKKMKMNESIEAKYLMGKYYALILYLIKIRQRSVKMMLSLLRKFNIGQRNNQIIDQ